MFNLQSEFSGHFKWLWEMAAGNSAATEQYDNQN